MVSLYCIVALSEDVCSSCMHGNCLLLEAAAMQVLSEAGPAGLNVVEIAKRIQRQGLRDLRTAKSPEVINLGCHCSSGSPHA